MSSKGKYWVRWRQIGVVFWLVALFSVPFAAEKLKVFPLGMGFVPFCLCLVAGVPLFFSRVSVSAGVVATVILASINIFSPHCCRIVNALDHHLQDGFFLFRGPVKPSGEVVIVDIDQKSLEEFGQWPWPRTQLAKAVRAIDADGARAIGFDIVFAEPDRLSLKDWATRLSSMGVKGDFDVNEGVVKEIVLSDWQKRLEQADPTFLLKGKVGEKAIVDGYLAFAKRCWDDEELTTLKRMERAGFVYSPRPFVPPQEPLQAMGRASRELFYINEHRAVAVADNDLALAEAIRDTRAVTGGLFILESSAGAKMAPFRKYESLYETQGMVVSKSIVGTDSIFPSLRLAHKQVVNVPVIQAACYHQGMFNLVPDETGAARYYTAIMKAPTYQASLVPKADLEGQQLLDADNYETKIVSQYFTYPSLSLELFRKAYGCDVAEAKELDGQIGLVLRRSDGLGSSMFLSLNESGDLPINYLGFGGRWQPECHFGPEYYFSYVSLSDVVKGNFKKETFKNKCVIIGSSDPTLSDLVGSPFHPAFPGVEVHATLLDNMITKNILVDSGQRGVFATFFGVLLGGTVLTVLVASAPVWLAAAMAVTSLVAVPSIGFLFFSQGNFIVPVVFLWVALLVIAAAVMLVNFFIEGREARFVTAQFSAMVSPKVLESLRHDPKSASLGGQRSQVTVMFSDVEGFTTISEALTPKELVEVLNDYLTPMTDIILKHDGFIDKFIGDAIMGCWGVPFPDESHAVKACRAVIEQQKTLRQVAADIKERYGVAISVRTGMASGEVSAAMMGSESKKNYTVMGDAVNIGARLEPACNDYGVKVLICEDTYQNIKEYFPCRLIDKIVVKGKTVPIKIYELLVEPSADELESAKLYTQALEKYWDRQWEEALKLLNTLSLEDKAVSVLKRRIEAFIESPPAPDWDGAYRKTSK